MEELQVTAVFPNIAPDGLAEFKELAAQAVEQAGTEPGTLQYDWFLSDDGRRCVVRERYASSEAVLAHLGNAGAMLGRLVELAGGVELEVFGEPSPELLAATSAFQPVIYAYVHGM